MERVGQKYKNDCLVACKELGYSEEVYNKIKNAKNDQEISTIMYVEAMKIGEEDGE